MNSVKASRWNRLFARLFGTDLSHAAVRDDRLGPFRRYWPIYLDDGKREAVLLPFPWMRKRPVKINNFRETLPRTSMDTHERSFWTLILTGQYREITPDGTYIRRAGDFFYRKAPWPHCIVIDKAPVWTVLFCGPKIGKIRMLQTCRPCWERGIVRLATTIDPGELIFRGPQFAQGLCDAHVHQAQRVS